MFKSSRKKGVSYMEVCCNQISKNCLPYNVSNLFYPSVVFRQFSSEFVFVSFLAGWHKHQMNRLSMEKKTFKMFPALGSFT